METTEEERDVVDSEEECENGERGGEKDESGCGEREEEVEMDKPDRPEWRRTSRLELMGDPPFLILPTRVHGLGRHERNSG